MESLRAASELEVEPVALLAFALGALQTAAARVFGLSERAVGGSRGTVARAVALGRALVGGDVAEAGE